MQLNCTTEKMQWTLLILFFFFLTELDFNDGGQGGQETDMVISSRKMNSAKAIFMVGYWVIFLLLLPLSNYS